MDAMSKRLAPSHSLKEQNESKKPKLDRPAESDGSLQIAVEDMMQLVDTIEDQVSQPVDTTEDEGHSLDDRMAIVSMISDHWVEGTIAEYLPEHAYPADGKGDVLKWPFALLKALLELSHATSGQDDDLRSKLAGAFLSAKRYSLPRSIKKIKAVYDSFVKMEVPETPDGEASLEHDTISGVAGTKTKKNEPKRKAGEVFTPWKPEQASINIPEVQPHWGIVPRPGGYRPSEIQPPAQESDAAVCPPLWEDRKGAVRIKRGSCFIDDYDQAHHMWLPLMDMRPINRKNQAPRRKPMGYYYKHGMPTDWNEVGLINDLNKALQEAIKAKSNKEPTFTAVERNVLAKIFAENPRASIWDIAEQFNEEVHPINGSEEGQYPKGCSIESIRHEYLMYKFMYNKGEAPTNATETDLTLEKLYAANKAASSKKKADRGKGATFKTSSYQKTSGTAGVAKNSTSKKAAEKANDEPAESDVLMAEQPRLSEDDKFLLEAAGAYTEEGVRPSSPMNAASRAVVESSSYGIETFEQDEQVPVGQTSAEAHESFKFCLPNNSGASNNVLSGPVTTGKSDNIKQHQAFAAYTQTEKTGNQYADHTETIVQETHIEAVATVKDGATVFQDDTTDDIQGSTFFENAMRNKQSDEDYTVDDECGYLREE